MLAVDTNVVVRLLLDDDRAQASIAKKVVGNNTVWLSTTVLLECEWVLRGAAKLDRSRIHHALRAFLGLPTVRVQAPERVAQALDWFAAGMDFADALHLASSHECEAFASFDRKLAAAAKKASAIKVKTL